MRDANTIQAEIAELKRLRPLIPAHTFFGDSNLDVIDAEIAVLSNLMGRLSIEAKFTDPNDEEGRVLSAALDALNWKLGSNPEAPSAAWLPLAKKSEEAAPEAEAEAEEEAEETEGFWCQSCEKGYEFEDDLEPIYTCNACGTTFLKSNSSDGDSNRCPSCNKFSSKDSDLGCPDCEQECEKATLVKDPDTDEWVKKED